MRLHLAFFCYLMFGFSTVGFAGRLTQPLLFKVTPLGKTAPVSYIFGSQHYGFGIDDLPPTFLNRFDGAQLYFFEIRFAQQFDAVKKYLANPDDEKLLFNAIPKTRDLPKNNLSESDLLTLERFGIHRPLAERLPPHNCELLGQFVYFASVSNLRSLDGELELRAMSQKKRIEPLETEEDRKAAERYAREQGQIDSDEKCVISDLLKNSDALKQRANETKIMMEEYSAFTPNDILTSSADPSLETQYRNGHWLKELQRLFQTTPTFVSVGIDHLPGDTGILQLLRDSGFEVVPAN